ncbi:MAG: hypothetical protein DWQ19_11425 [Crenarchaeota archaeon]|nr:MAG: hypothetical protein DWQ19_11425 [Thermoproteota archaeon]
MWFWRKKISAQGGPVGKNNIAITDDALKYRKDFIEKLNDIILNEAIVRADQRQETLILTDDVRKVLRYAFEKSLK